LQSHGKEMVAANRTGDRTAALRTKVSGQRPGSPELLKPTGESYVSGEHRTLDLLWLQS